MSSARVIPGKSKYRKNRDRSAEDEQDSGCCDMMTNMLTCKSCCKSEKKPRKKRSKKVSNNDDYEPEIIVEHVIVQNEPNYNEKELELHELELNNQNSLYGTDEGEYERAARMQRIANDPNISFKSKMELLKADEKQIEKQKRAAQDAYKRDGVYPDEYERILKQQNLNDKLMSQAKRDSRITHRNIFCPDSVHSPCIWMSFYFVTIMIVIFCCIWAHNANKRIKDASQTTVAKRRKMKHKKREQDMERWMEHTRDLRGDNWRADLDGYTTYYTNPCYTAGSNNYGTQASYYP